MLLNISSSLKSLFCNSREASYLSKKTYFYLNLFFLYCLKIFQENHKSLLLSFIFLSVKISKNLFFENIQKYKKKYNKKSNSFRRKNFLCIFFGFSIDLFLGFMKTFLYHYKKLFDNSLNVQFLCF